MHASVTSMRFSSSCVNFACWSHRDVLSTRSSFPASLLRASSRMDDVVLEMGHFGLRIDFANDDKEPAEARGGEGSTTWSRRRQHGDNGSLEEVEDADVEENVAPRMSRSVRARPTRMEKTRGGGGGVGGGQATGGQLLAESRRKKEWRKGMTHGPVCQRDREDVRGVFWSTCK